MELYVYSSDMVLQGIVEKIASLIWTRRYWTCGEFKLLVPFTEEHSRMLVKNNIIMKRGDDEAAQIRYVHITKNSQGLEEIEVQGKFLIAWIGKRIIKKQIITKDTTQSILYRIVRENVTSPTDSARKIPDTLLVSPTFMSTPYFSGIRMSYCQTSTSPLKTVHSTPSASLSALALSVVAVTLQRGQFIL